MQRILTGLFAGTIVLVATEAHTQAPAFPGTAQTMVSPIRQGFHMTKNFQPTSVLPTGPKSVWVAGYQRNRFILLSSSDAGLKWTEIRVPSSIPGQLANTSSLARNHENLAVPQIAIKPGGHIWMAWRGLRTSVLHVAITHDDGRHWQLTTVAVDTPMANWVSEVTFVNEKDGWLLVGGGGAAGSAPLWIYRTVDGGAQWHATTRHGLPLAVSADMSANLVFQTPRVGWLATNSTAPGIHLYRTTTGGRSWQRLRMPVPQNMAISTNIAGPSFSQNGKNGLFLLQYSATTGGSQIATYQTQDGGAIWTMVRSSLRIPPQSIVQAPAIFNNRVAWFWINSSLEKTQDSGTNWTRVAVDTQGELSDKNLARSMVLVSPSTAWMVNELTLPDEKPFHSELMRTTNGGVAWQHTN